MTGVTEAPEFQLEARDTELAISFWNQKAKRFGKPPPATEFNLIGLASQSFRFVICADLLVSDGSFFLAYGPSFAKLFDLLERPSMHVAMIRYIPDRYRFLFSDGCNDAIAEAAPVRCSGEIAGSAGVELYRACFMPLRLSPSTMQAIYGSFNYLTRPAAELCEHSSHDGVLAAEASSTFPALPIIRS